MAIEKKKFFEIELPIINEKIELISTSEDKLAGRTVRMDLTRRLRGKSLEAVFKISSEQGKLVVKPFRLSIFGYFIRRMMRKSISYAEDSFDVECKNAIIKVKPFMITRQKISKAVLNAVRLKAREEIKNEAKEKTYEEVFSDILQNKFQRTLSLKLKKVYPLAFCEIRDTFVVKEIPYKAQAEKVSETPKAEPITEPEKA